jgi:hypothetical protein
MTPHGPADRRRSNSSGGTPLGILVLATCVWALGPRLEAHEIGTTRAAVTFADDGGFEVVLSADAASLLARLEAAAGRPRSGSLTGSEYDRRIAEQRRMLLQHVRLSFDGQMAQPTVDLAVEDTAESSGDLPAPPREIIRLHGRVPSGARTFTWQYGLTSASYALTVTPSGTAASATQWLNGEESRTFSLDRLVVRRSAMRTAAAYLLLGFTHIVPNGIDHILFVLGIFLFSRRLRPILWQVSAFTAAHSISLALTVCGIVSVAPSVVEPLIALSIVYVAVENLLTSELKPWRVGLVFAFGLLHGMGFAGALHQIGLPRSELVMALIAFNAGVEAGQLAVIGVAVVLVARWSDDRRAYRRSVVVPGSASIALTGLYWTFARLPLDRLASGLF